MYLIQYHTLFYRNEYEYEYCTCFLVGCYSHSNFVTPPGGLRTDTLPITVLACPHVPVQVQEVLGLKVP